MEKKISYKVGTCCFLVAQQLERKSVGIEIDPENMKRMQKRLTNMREADSIDKYYKDYICTDNLAEILGSRIEQGKPKMVISSF